MTQAALGLGTTYTLMPKQMQGLATSPAVNISQNVAVLTDPRVFALRRDSVRARYMRRGVAIVTWSEGRPFEQAIEEVRIFRRHARHATA